tara:strand:- start:333 stop:629 length:297 start_codon:yes stop_codon:yes gene_type:complete
MKIIKIVGLTLLLVIAAPTIISVISSFYNVNCELVCCEKQTEEEKNESKSEKDIDGLEEPLLSASLIERHCNVCVYSFRGKRFIDIVSDIVTPPPELA